MIQEPARVQAAPTFEATIREDNAKYQETAAGGTYSSPNCSCSQRRTRPTEPTKDSPTSTITTIPIVIDSKPNPRILLIRVPTSNRGSNSNNNSNSTRSGTEHRAPRTRIIRIPFLPGSVPTRPPSNQAAPATSSLVNPIGSARRCRISTYPTTGTLTSRSQPETVAGLPTTAMVNQTVPVLSSAPQTQTLAAMAGIQLTGADEPPSRRDVSGAMPTATVEEIDVPVFIDEYLQDIEATSSTCNSENGKEIFTETDILDFDINMFAEEDLIELEGKKTDPFSPAMDGMNNDNLDDDFLQLNDLLNEEETFDMSSMSGVGIDINQEQELDFINIFHNSQPTAMLTSSEDPYLATYSQATSTSSTTKFITEEPLLADMTSFDISYTSSQELGFGLVEDVSGSFASSCSDVAAAIPAPIQHPIITNIKRSAPAPVESQPTKRSRLMLQIKTELAPAFSPTTPEIINQLLNDDRFEAPTTSTSTSTSNTSISSSTHADIVEDLRSAEEETTTDFSAPNTPHSNYSASSSCAAPTCQTGYGGFLTAPTSPAYSTASTSVFSPSPASGISGKRKRGRPAKDHADGPDPVLMSSMKSEEERKAYQDRLKNNEASRVSRRKTKVREEEEKRAEDTLLAENLRLRARADEVASRERKFKKYLMERQRQKSTYVKQEQD
uniref:Xrp1, isoform A n=3 Tax=Drosophila melanogaster TaxID=7227 RepID=Q9VE23_DROME|nr:Xrp1, isoform F [Drosophila melanogaster]NP_001262719.1 Xrp1, isoform G [Drosophila melanogaster]NP_650761.2 Xrp1, isoform B [Drosophila melanogaster]NP_732384.1 Xrp1, isoform A [Drosophila melanogaster]AAF55608.2 Xrp1, isoform A [Drosophila melanogaster]AAN13791.1 Xrp1, isoform B [Drosophila melanogaster]AGB96098.1 Xrp1, isoform F [Drosophila melanogaster]AGB96099.1 Xrp1, isoform G [Drosophila melanogaster]|eukprot:NP_001262718.1 Xrp1, isoform F [Drosophila melanogaster]